MNKIKYIVSIAVLALVFFSCKDEFLEHNPQGALDGAALASPAGIETSLVSAYSMLDGWSGQWGNFGPWARDAGHWVWGDVTSDDSYKGSDASDLAEFTEFELFQWRGSNGLLDDYWQSQYEGVARANATIALNNASENPDSEVDGQAKFLRAHYHFNLWKMFKNIPYYTEEDFDFRKANDQDIFPNMIADMTDAFNQLPNSFAEVGRVTKGAADAYLGKMYMYNGDLESAKPHLERVAGATYGYELADCYHDNFDADFENGPESILAVQFSVNDGDGAANNGNYGTRLGFPHSGSPFGCCGFHQPTQNLVNQFKTGADGLPTTAGGDIGGANAADMVDPRLDWSVGRDDVPYYDHGNHNPSWIRDRAFAGPFSPKKQQFHAHHSDAIGSGAIPGAWGNQVSAINYNIIRLADVILMLAEVEAQIGSTDVARQLVNRVRARAANCAQGAGTGAADIRASINDASITWATYNVQEYPMGHSAFASRASALDAVKLERRIELSNEGHRTFDLRRWGDLESVMNAYLDTEQVSRSYIANHNTVEAIHYVFPLPTTQIDLSEVDGEPRLQQNTGF